MRWSSRSCTEVPLKVFSNLSAKDTTPLWIKRIKNTAWSVYTLRRKLSKLWDRQWIWSFIILIYLFAVLFWMPELASYWFNWFIQSFGKYQKRSALIGKFHFGTCCGMGKGFLVVSPQIRSDELIIWIRGYFRYSVIYILAKYLQKGLLCWARSQIPIHFYLSCNSPVQSIKLLKFWIRSLKRFQDFWKCRKVI